MGQKVQFYNFRAEILVLLEMKVMDVPQLIKHERICYLAFLMDLTAYVNKVNLRLQGEIRCYICVTLIFASTGTRPSGVLLQTWY
jgi:hypothetical protein